MNEIDPSKYEHIISKNRNSSSKFRKYINNLLIRSLFVFIILISAAIIYRSNSNLKNDISNYFFSNDISFTKIKKVYDKYLGGVLPIKKDNTSTTEVFNEKLKYSDSSIFHDGVKLIVDDSYLVPSIDEGMVVFVGEKDNYGNTIIIENLDGIDFWYCNISSSSLKLYDYVEKGSYIGEVQGELYLVFSMDDKYLNYEEYIY